MKRIHLLQLFLLTACSMRPGVQAPVPTRPSPELATTVLPAITETIQPNSYPYPVFEPVSQPTPYMAPDEITESTLAPSPDPTQTINPTATVIRPTPAFPASLDSLRIAFTAEKKLWIWYKGETKLLTEMEEDTARVSISSDGKIVAYRVSSGLWAINTDGTGKRLLVGKDRLQVVNPNAPEKKTLLSLTEWIPNTHRLLLSTSVDPEGECCYIDNNDLYRVDADTLSLQTLLPPGESGTVFYSSPDGDRVALVSRDGIDLLDLHTGGKFNLIQYEPIMYPSEEGGYTAPLWSSDSQFLMVVVPPPDIHYGTELPSKIWKLPVNHDAPELVSTLGPKFGFVILSPDFLKVATERRIGNEGITGTWELHIANIDGSEDEIYQTGTATFRSWSPDSTYFLFARPDETSYLGQKSASPVELPFPANNLRWVDGRTCLYPEASGKMEEIRVGFIDGSSILLVGPTPIYSFDFAR